MAILQLLLSLITRSAGRILNAIFGWAVRALFGRTSPKEQTVLSALVGGAAAWPLLVLGVAAPRISTMALAFVPLPRFIPSWTIRVAWLALAVLLPIVIGLVVAAKAPGPRHEPWVKRVLRGFPITLGLAGAFLVMFATVPVLRVASLLRKRRDENVPLVTSAATYRSVAELTERVLDRRGFELERVQPAWWVTWPSRILLRMGGGAFRQYVPVELAYFRAASGMEIALYPNGLLLRGREDDVGAAHGLLAEALTRSEAFQTTDIEAQRLETRIKRVWEMFDRDPIGNRENGELRGALDRIAVELCRVRGVPYDEWQVLYRQALQLSRALDGEPQLLDRETSLTRGERARLSELRLRTQ
ncbi:MAG TPA: hypothetical protein VFF06_27460 [Polyangia bacterium]|nr:hypothetical protein [Polyangia bacterium]